MRIRSRLHTALLATLFSVWTVFSFAYTASAQDADNQTSSVSDDESVVVSETAPPFSVTPVVANEKAKPRDIIKKELIISNNTLQKIDLYLTVEDVDPISGDQEYAGVSSSDLSTSLASWVEITRGVIDLEAGESRKIPYLVHVNLTAKPGSYFAHIQAREGSNRAQAEGREDGATLMLNVEVLDDAKERLQLGTFTTDDSVIFGDHVSFSYLLENIGNRDIEPRGSIRIFNRRGEEVGSVPLNADGVDITPENKEQLAAAWSAGGRFGKYKAFLDLEYGENQLASVQDTVYFWVFPWKEMLAALMGVLVLAVVGTFIIHMRAVARPRPVYQAQYSQKPASQYTAPQPIQTQTGMRRITRSSPTVLGQAQGQHTTAPVVHVDRPEHYGNTISLAPRSQHGAAVKGSTVTLAPRR